MNYNNIKNCKWANAKHSFIDCEVDFEDLAEEYVPYTAEQGTEIFAKAVNGDFGNIQEYAEPELDLIEVRRHDIINRLSMIDSEKIRPVSELLINSDSTYAKAKLESLEKEAVDLRNELGSL